MGIISDMKKDMTENVVDAILEDKKTKDMIQMANPFIKPTLKSILKELGPDEYRFMLFLDNNTGRLCFLKLKTDNIKSFETVEPIKREDVFLIDPEEIKKGNVTDIIKAIIKKIGVKIM